MNPAELAATCPKCGYPLWARRRGQWTMRSAILKLGGSGQFIAKCPEQRCDGELLVPWLHLDDGTQAPRFLVARRLDKRTASSEG